ncbi:MAG: hypothetical protein ACNA8W_26510, partial [Bradymonadaceae bacterium]
MDVDCRESTLCIEEGRCRVEQGRCVRADEITESCEAPTKFIDGECRLAADFECASSSYCENENRCKTLVQEHCDSSGVCSGKFVACGYLTQHCEAQPSCAENGACVGSRVSSYPYNKCMAMFGSGRGEMAMTPD